MGWMSADLPQRCGFCSECRALTPPFLLLSRSRSEAEALSPSEQMKEKQWWILIKLGKTSGGKGML